jgi:hypothetical protein
VSLLSNNLNGFGDGNHWGSIALKTERPVWTGLSRLAEAFSLYWLPSSPRQPHSPLERILVKTFFGSIGALQLFAVFMASETPSNSANPKSRIAI